MNRQYSQFKWKEYLQVNRPDIFKHIQRFKNWCNKYRPKKQIFDTEQELLEALLLYDNTQRNRNSEFDWRQYLKENRPDIFKHIDRFRTWCVRNRPKKTIFDAEQELLETISLYDNRENKRSDFDYKQYLEYKRPDIYKHIDRFKSWCTDNRPKKSVFDTEQELLETLPLYDNRVKGTSKRSDFDWQQYLKEKRKDISIEGFKSWCKNNREKHTIFDTEQELLLAIQLYENRENRKSQFKSKKYIQENRPDINIGSFKNWCTSNRPKKQIFDTEQELLEAISLYDNRKIYSQFNWQQYLQEKRPDIFKHIQRFKNWCNRYRQKRQIFDTEQELLQTLQVYDLLCELDKKYIVQKTQYEGIYNLTERETGLRFNFYKFGDMLGLIQ